MGRGFSHLRVLKLVGLVLPLLVPPSLLGQPTLPYVQYQAVAPTGPCANAYIVVSGSTIYACVAGVWASVSGGGAAPGTLTSFASTATVGTLFTTSVANPTTTPVQTIALASAAANTFFATPNGSSGVGSYRAIVAADIPTLNQSTTGNAATATALAATPTLCSAGNAPLGILANGNATGCQGIGTTLFTSYQFGSQTALTGNGLYLQTTYPNIFSLAQSGAGTIGSPYVDAISLASQTQNTFFAAPNGSGGSPSFRAIVAADVPTLNQNTTGNAATATSATSATTAAALTSTPTLCSAGSAPRGILANGNASGCAVYQGALTLTTTGSNGPATLVGTTLNVPQYTGGQVTWQLSGSTIVTSSTVNAIPGSGTTIGLANVGGVSTLTFGLDSTVALTIASFQAGSPLFCSSTNLSTSYTCTLATGNLAAYTSGAVFPLLVDTTCATSCSLTIAPLTGISIKKPDGTTDPTGTLIAGQPQWVFYNGALNVFQLMAGSGGGGGGGGSGVVGTCATTGALAYYAATGTTTGCVGSTLTFAGTTLTDTAGTVDFSAATTELMPVSSGCVADLDGKFCYDTAGKIVHFRTNGADSLNMTTAGTDTTTTDSVYATATPGLYVSRPTVLADLPAQTGSGLIVLATNPILSTPSLGTGPITNTYTVNATGTTIHLLAAPDASGNVGTAVSAATVILGCAEATKTVGQSVEVDIGGVSTCIADNTVTARNLLGVGVTTAGRVRDLGSTSDGAISDLIIGRALTGGAAGSLIQMEALTPHYGAGGSNAIGCNVSVEGGGSFDARLNGCIASGATYIDARNFSTTQTMTSVISNTTAGLTIDLPAVTIVCPTGSGTDCFKNTASNVVFRGQGKELTTIQLNSGGSSQTGFHLTNPSNSLGTHYNLVTDAIEGGKSFTISSGDFTALAPVAGDILAVQDMTGTIREQTVRVLSASTPTITIDGVFGYGIFVVAGAFVARVSSIPVSVTLENLTIDCNHQTTPYGTKWDFTAYSTIRNVRFKNCAQGAMYSNYGFGNRYLDSDAWTGGSGTGANWFLVYQSNYQQSNIQVESRGLSGSFNSNTYQSHFGNVSNFTVAGGNTDGRGFKMLGSTHNNIANLQIGDAGGSVNGIGLKMEQSNSFNKFTNLQVLGTTQQGVTISGGSDFNQIVNGTVRFGTDNAVSELVDFTRNINVTGTFTLTYGGTPGQYTLTGPNNFANNGGPPNDCNYGNCVGMVLGTSGFTNGVNNTHATVTAISSDGKTLTCSDGTGTTVFITENSKSGVTLLGNVNSNGTQILGGYYGDARGSGAAAPAIIAFSGSGQRVIGVNFHEDQLGGSSSYANGLTWFTNSFLNNKSPYIEGNTFFGIPANHDIFFQGSPSDGLFLNNRILDGMTLNSGTQNRFMGTKDMARPTCSAIISGSQWYVDSTTVDTFDTCMQLSAGVYAWVPMGPLVPLITPGTTPTLTAPKSYAVCTGTCTVSVPVPQAGYQFCVYNGDNVATAITLSALGSSAMYENTARTAYGTPGTGTLAATAVVGNAVCIFGLDSTHYLTTSFVGTWTAN